MKVRGYHDAGEGVDHYHVEPGRVECRTEVRDGGSLLFGRRPADHDLLDLETPLSQAGDHARVVQVAAGLAVRIPNGDETDAQGNSSGQRVFAGGVCVGRLPDAHY